VKVEQAELIARKAIIELGVALEKGHSERLKKFLSAMAKLHNYSVRNLMLIMSQRPDATVVAGRRTWKSLGRRGKKGAKPILILAPVVGKKARGRTSQTKRGARGPVGFRAAYLFDVTDTMGEPLPQLGVVHGDPGEYTERLKKFIAARGIELKYTNDILPTESQYIRGKMTVLPGLSPAQEFATLAHETAHALLHRKPGRRDGPRWVRETEAEAVAYVVCEAVGVKSPSSADYVHLSGGDAGTLADSLDRVQRASAEILAAILPGD